MRHSVITNQALINQSKPGSGNEPTNMQRRTLIGGALVALLSSPGRVMAKETAEPNDSFVVLLKGVYEPVVDGPNLGLSEVNLGDGSYSITKIYPVNGIPGNTNPNTAVGDFYVQFSGDLCAYHVPGGSFAMRFTGSDYVLVDDEHGGGADLGWANSGSGARRSASVTAAAGRSCFVATECRIAAMMRSISGNAAYS